MAKQQEEPYHASAAPTAQHCVVTGCAEPVAAEAHAVDYSRALEMFRGRRRATRSRRAGDERFFAGRRHLHACQRIRSLHWQDLLF
jgi:hypothetical protein